MEKCLIPIGCQLFYTDRAYPLNSLSLYIYIYIAPFKKINKNIVHIREDKNQYGPPIQDYLEPIEQIIGGLKL
jgi:hypothetical protein